MVLFHRDWPANLGQVVCPVTLIHGEQDANAPFETAREYCAMCPNWRFISYPDEGELVAHVRWTDVLDFVERALGSSLPPVRPAARYADSPHGKRADIHHLIDAANDVPCWHVSEGGGGVSTEFGAWRSFTKSFELP